MSTNQKIILLIILIGSVTAIGVYEMQPQSTTEDNSKKGNNGGPLDEKVTDAGNALINDSGDDSDSQDSASDSGGGASDGGTIEFGDEIATAENRSDGNESEDDSDSFDGRIPPVGEDSGGDTEGTDGTTSEEETENQSNTSDSSDTADGSDSSNTSDGSDTEDLIEGGDSSGNSESSGSDASTSGGAERTYTVQAGDKLWSIAKQFYGSGKEWKRIKKANQDVLPEDNKLSRGMTLTIPEMNQEGGALSERTSGSSNPDQTPGSNAGSSDDTIGTTYEVKSGDRLWNIVERKYGTATYDRVQKIADINDIDPDNLKRGMQITLPDDLFDVSSSELASDNTDSSGGSSSSGDGPPFEAGPNQEWYKVKKGESLWKISKKNYGEGKHLWKIWNLNKDRFEDYDAIPEGSWVLIPKNP